MRRAFADFDWNLRACGRHGHVTYRPSEEDLSARLHVDTPTGEAWRCLRCATYVPGEPHGSGPADDAPLVLRGTALRDTVILRLLAAERLIRGAVLALLAYGVYRFQGSQTALSQVFREYLPLLRPIADRVGVDLDTLGPIKIVQEALHTSHGTLLLISAGVLGYGCLNLLEGVGLWLLERWGEYVAAVATSVFIPVEIYEMAERLTWLRLLLLLVNIAAVAYLLWTKRLFGLRGGRAAYEDERHGASVIEIERAGMATE